MAVPVAMPKLGMTMEEGTVLSWSVTPGEHVEKGAILYVIESEKTEAEIEAACSGELRHVYVEAGETVACGTLLAALSEEPDESFDAEAFRAEHDHPEPVATASAPAPPVDVSAPTPKEGARRAVAPAARKRARDQGVDLDRVTGTGPGGRVTRQDVDDYVASRERLVPVADGVALEVPRLGDGDPVLLLPGFGTDVSAFAVQAPVLAEAHLVLGVNPRGVGLSDAVDAETLAVATTAADAAAVIEAPAHVVGASLGAAAALELALTAPEKVRSLTLVTPFVRGDARLLAVTDAWTRLAAATSPDLLSRFLLPWLFSAGWLADDALRERALRGLAASVARVAPATLAAAASGLRAWSGTRADALADVSVPTLVVTADGDLLTRDGAAIAAAIPGAAHLAVPEAGHAVALEAGLLVTARLQEHFAAH